MLHLLPTETLVSILSHLTLPELALTIFPIRNRRLRETCRTPTFCTVVAVDRDWDSNTARRVVRMASCETLLELRLERRFEDSNPLALLALKSSPNLVWLKCVLPTYELVSALGSSSSSVRKLTLKGQYDDLRLYPSGLGNLTSCLTALSLGAEDSLLLNDHLVRSLADHCGRRLEHLELPALNEMDGQTLSYLLHKVRRTITFLSLPVVVNNSSKRYLLQDKQAKGSSSLLPPPKPSKYILQESLPDSSFQGLRRCERLEVLKIGSSSSGLGIMGVKAIVKLTKLKTLFLASCVKKKTDSEKCYYGRIFSSRRHLGLTSLHLHWKGCLDDEDLMRIAESCPDLERLDLTGCSRVGDRGVGSALSKCERLTCLWLSGTDVTAKAFFVEDDDDDGVEVTFVFIKRLRYLHVDKFVRDEVAKRVGKSCEVFRGACLECLSCDGPGHPYYNINNNNNYSTFVGSGEKKRNDADKLAAICCGCPWTSHRSLV